MGGGSNHQIVVPKMKEPGSERSHHHVFREVDPVGGRTHFQIFFPRKEEPTSWRIHFQIVLLGKEKPAGGRSHQQIVVPWKGNLAG